MQQLRVKLDVRQPLKQQAKVKNKGGEWCMVNFKYEKLGLFCFFCGLLGHSEQKYEVRFAMAEEDGVQGWSNNIREYLRRNGGGVSSRWLKNENPGEIDHGKVIEIPHAREMHNPNMASGDVTRGEENTEDIAISNSQAIFNHNNGSIEVVQNRYM